MTTYLALLRGINVGGANKVPMRELRTLFEDLGYGNVRTYLQSGNVLFDGQSATSRKLIAEIEVAISKAFDLTIPVMVRTQRELERVAAANPFPTKRVKPSLLHVMFLAESASAKAVKTLDSDRSPPDEFEVKDREIFLRFPNGSGRSKLTIDYFEKKLGTRATARNWNTVVKVLELMKRS
ncbi:MAG: DUF1697 domain-containing protein [Actinomycetota bacterium]